MDYKTSRAIVMKKPRTVNLREIQLTPLHADSIVCKTIMSGISSGTDMKTWRGEQPKEVVSYPLVPGYENVGEIVYIEGHVDNLSIGDRVMINECRKFKNIEAAWGGNSEYVVKDSFTSGLADTVAKIPNNLSYKDAVLAYLPCVSLKGVQRIPLDSSQNVLVIGSGMIGVGTMQILKIMYPGIRVMCMEKHPFRREIAAKYADYVIPFDGSELDKIFDFTDGKKADVLIECSGNSSIVGGLHKYVKEGGWSEDDTPAHIHLQGDYPKQILFDPYNNWFCKNLTITMTCAIKYGSKAQILDWMSSGKFDTDLPIEIWPVGKCAEAYKYKQDKGEDVFKILFDWRE